MIAGIAADISGALLFGALFLLLLALAEFMLRRRLGGPETTRKLAHVGGGLLSLTLPWLVRSPAVVLCMSAGLALLFLWAQRHAALRSLHGVSRRSAGTAYFPAAVFLVYLLAYDNYWLYVCAILVLAVADAFAALIGSAYGRLRYEIENESKSLEGSLVFLLIAFLALHLPMLLMTDLPRVVCVLAALLVAVLVTGFEAVSMGGADNLFIPLGVAVILAKITSKPVTEIVYQNVSLAILGLAVALTARRARSFNAGGTIMFVLFTYGAWSLGSERWALPILGGFVVYTAARIVFSTVAQRENSRVRPRILFRALAIPLLLLVTGNMFDQGPFFFAPFAVALAAVLSFALWSHIAAMRLPPAARRPGYAALTGLAAWTAVVLPAWIWTPGNADLVSLPLAAVIVVAVTVLDDRLLGPVPSFTGGRAWTAARVALTAAAAVIVMLSASFHK